MKIILAISGASGIQIACKVAESLKEHELHLIISNGARQVAKYEEVKLGSIEKLAYKTYDEMDLGSALASSSNIFDVMAVVPTSMKTLAQIANGCGENLICRSAENMLKLGKKLVIMPRETPLTLSAIENMKSLKLGGALIVPPSMAYYFKPKTIDDVTCFFAGKVLDAMGLDHELYERWGSADSQ